MGDRKEHLTKAVQKVKLHCPLIDHSSLYNTSPVGYRNQADFLNMVIKVDASSYTPTTLLLILKEIEREQGRVESFRWGPRSIDIDILYVEGVNISSQNLTIPHQELMNRLFVLIPLSELTETLLIEGVEVVLRDRIEFLKASEGSVEDVRVVSRRESIQFHG
jgi:2-amino-4-hydroxy-6-hydroxymethyldihydropteridine diphosphokinase